MARRTFNREFKISAVRLVTQQGYSVADAAKSLGVDASSVRDWLKRFGNETPNDGTGPAGPAGAGAGGSVRAELHRLRAENARLRMERDILKKATAFFAKEQS
jgi:transposase